jgi:hypothetical protein
MEKPDLVFSDFTVMYVIKHLPGSGLMSLGAKS